MGFRREARRVRDVTLAHSQRLRSLTYCLEWARPVGFHPSWHYLEATIGVPPESIEFLDPAIDLLERERALHLELDQRYSNLRRQQKRPGDRTPRPETATPRSPTRWHGDEQAAAVHALRWWLQSHPLQDFVDQPETKLAVDVARALTLGSGPASVDRAGLQGSLDWARVTSRDMANQTAAKRRRAHQVLVLLGHIFVALDGAPLVGCPWNFIATPDDPGCRAAVARTCFRRPLGFWRSTPHAGVRHLNDVAADLLVLGYDTPALRELAGMSSSDSFYEIEPVVIAALNELGISDLLSLNVNREGFVARLGLFLDGAMTLRELSAWAHRVIGHDGEDDLQPFVLLDDIYDYWENAGLSLEYLDLVTRKAARDFLAGRPATRLERIKPPAS